MIGGRAVLRFALFGQPNDTDGGVVTKEFVMEAILCKGDPEPGMDSEPPDGASPDPGKNGDL